MRVLTLVNSGLFCEGGIDTLLSFFLGVGGGGVQKNFCAPPGYFSCGGTEDLLKPLKPQKTATFPKQFEKPSNFWKQLVKMGGGGGGEKTYFTVYAPPLSTRKSMEEGGTEMRIIAYVSWYPNNRIILSLYDITHVRVFFHWIQIVVCLIFLLNSFKPIDVFPSRAKSGLTTCSQQWIKCRGSIINNISSDVFKILIT